MKTSLLNCPAPAKLNLFLRIVGYRSDGYHLLQTVFQLIDRCDTLDISVRYDGHICRTNDIPTIPKNTDIVVQAGRLLQTVTKQQLGANITIKKKLPIGGGLGGGSSDAATTLIILNYLWQTKLNHVQLMQLGLKLGADVSFFLLGTNAFAKGIGEILLPIKTPNFWFVIIEPGVFVSTKKIFLSARLTKNTKPIKMSKFSEKEILYNSSFWKNDLETVVIEQFPMIYQALQWLKNFGNAKISGSGSCIFCAFENEHNADKVLQQITSPWIAWKTKALQEHPIIHFLKVHGD